MVMSYHVWVLGTELGSSDRTIHTRRYRAGVFSLTTHIQYIVIFPVTLILFVCLLLHFIHFFVCGDRGHMSQNIYASQRIIVKKWFSTSAGRSQNGTQIALYSKCHYFVNYLANYILALKYIFLFF